jgi:hypothetical protein
MIAAPFCDSVSFAARQVVGQWLGIKEVDAGIWLVGSSHHNPGYFDLEQKTLQPSTHDTDAFWDHFGRNPALGGARNPQGIARAIGRHWLQTPGISTKVISRSQHGHHGTGFDRQRSGEPVGYRCDGLLRIRLGHVRRPALVAEGRRSRNGCQMTGFLVRSKP